MKDVVIRRMNSLKTRDKPTKKTAPTNLHIYGLYCASAMVYGHHIAISTDVKMISFQERD